MLRTFLIFFQSLNITFKNTTIILFIFGFSWLFVTAGVIYINHVIYIQPKINVILKLIENQQLLIIQLSENIALLKLQQSLPQLTPTVPAATNYLIAGGLFFTFCVFSLFLHYLTKTSTSHIMDITEKAGTLNCDATVDCLKSSLEMTGKLFKVLDSDTNLKATHLYIVPPVPPVVPDIPSVEVVDTIVEIVKPFL